MYHSPQGSHFGPVVKFLLFIHSIFAFSCLLNLTHVVLLVLYSLFPIPGPAQILPASGNYSVFYNPTLCCFIFSEGLQPHSSQLILEWLSKAQTGLCYSLFKTSSRFSVAPLRWSPSSLAWHPRSFMIWLLLTPLVMSRCSPAPAIQNHVMFLEPNMVFCVYNPLHKLFSIPKMYLFPFSTW